MGTVAVGHGGREPEQPSLRRRLPAERRSITHKFSIAGFDGYAIVGMYDDGTPGELFVVIAKEGSTISGLIDAWAIMVSTALQYRVPLEDVIRKMKGMSFEPQGYTSNPEIRFARSIVDYVARWLEIRFVVPQSPQLPQPPRGPTLVTKEPVASPAPVAGQSVITRSAIVAGQISSGFIYPVSASGGSHSPMSVEKEPQEGAGGQQPAADGPICISCGSIMIPSGRCHRCPNCGDTSGCS